MTIKRASNPRKTPRITVAHSLKDGVPMQFWYWVKLPCGGWLEFDVRKVARHVERELMMPPELNSRIWLHHVADFCGDLPGDPIATIQAAMDAAQELARQWDMQIAIDNMPF